MGQRFRLIALDMDGTLLNSGKAVTERSANAVNAALAAGYQVVLNTGRCPAELAEYYPLFPRLRYVNCISGALVYDLLEGRTMASVEMDPPLVRAILEIAAQEDAMMQLLSEKSYVEREKEKGSSRKIGEWQKEGRQKKHLSRSFRPCGLLCHEGGAVCALRADRPSCCQ